MTLFYAALFILSPDEEKLNDAYKRMTATTSSLTFNTFTAGEKANAANSHILVANNEALLVDAQLTSSEAKKLVKQIKKIGKPLKTIVITSAHPDRYLGLPVVQAAFPEAKVLAPAGVAKDIATQWAAAVTKARADHPHDEIADAGTPPAALGDKLELSGNLVQVITADGGETAHAGVLFVPSLNVMITGNLVCGKTHAWLGDKHFARWLALLDEVRRGREVGTVLTGRGDVGGETLFDEMKTYLKAATKGGASKMKNYRAPQVTG